MVRHGRRVPADVLPDEQSPPPPSSILAGYRLLRRISSGVRADVFLATVDQPVDADRAEPAPLVAVRVYGADVPGTSIAVEIEAMAADASGSLPELFDIASFDDGRCAIAVERLSGPSIARIIGERTLTPGEAVTVLAPIVVAVAELARLGFVHTRLSSGDIVLDDVGRPRLIGLGALQRLPRAAHERTSVIRSGHIALADFMDEVIDATRSCEELSAAAELLRSRLAARPFTPCEAELERALFAAAAPTPIGGHIVRVRPAGLPARVVAPLESALVGVDGHDRHGAEQATAPTPDRGRVRQTLLELAQWPVFLARRREGDTRDATGEGRPHVRSRFRQAVRHRRPVLLVGGLVGGGALVLLLTLVPPAGPGPVEAPAVAATAGTDLEAPLSGDGADGRADGANAATAPVIDPTVEDDASEPPDAAAPTGDDVVAAATALLDRRAECFASLDLECLSEVLQPGSASEADDLAALAIARDGGEGPPSLDTSRVSIAAEMGSAVLLSVPYAADEREPASLLVMRGEAGWRLREIFG